MQSDHQPLNQSPSGFLQNSRSERHTVLKQSQHSRYSGRKGIWHRLLWFFMVFCELKLTEVQDFEFIQNYESELTLPLDKCQPSEVLCWYFMVVLESVQLFMESHNRCTAYELVGKSARVSVGARSEIFWVCGDVLVTVLMYILRDRFLFELIATVLCAIVLTLLL